MVDREKAGACFSFQFRLSEILNLSAASPEADNFLLELKVLRVHVNCIYSDMDGKRMKDTSRTERVLAVSHVLQNITSNWIIASQTTSKRTLNKL